MVIAFEPKQTEDAFEHPDANVTVEELLLDASIGRCEWRVVDPDTNSICIAFHQDNWNNPEQEARAWFAEHSAQYPNSRFAHYQVKEFIVQDHYQRLMVDAADKLKRVKHERDELAGAIQSAAVKLGIITPDTSLTLPHLLMLCADMAKTK